MSRPDSENLHLCPPFRAEHVGSLLRPIELLEKREQFRNNQCSAQEVKAAEDAAIVSVVKLQQDVGMKTITDGEYRRQYFFEGMFEKLEGMTFVSNRDLSEFKSYVPYVQLYHKMGMKEAPSIFCTGKIKRTVGIHTEDFKYLRSLVPADQVGNIKITICSPIWLFLRHGSKQTYDLSVYKDDDEYFADLLNAYREEINELYSLGCRHIQIDDPSFSFFCDENMVIGMKEAGEDGDELLDICIKRYNQLLQGRPHDLTVSVHTCRGNFRGMHYSEGGYDRIATKLFTNLEVDCFYLEYDNERAGTLDPLRSLPRGKVVVLGLVTTKTGQLESVGEVKSRVDQAVTIISEGAPKRPRAEALAQICISPQCGFASVAEGNSISEEEQKEKLSLVVKAAEEIWPC
ncbi:hypothetical protein C8Q75DRAFT_768694 [Abortiporus biennis]|nr:hypothetical protein C8Q75DRAFT_768694 [Abortiporus biennis]